ncbi:MAG: hypothetical protein WBL84_13935 [Xanthobacteraceae bacterium]
MHWVEPQLVAEITYLTWTADNLLRHTVYVGLRDDKPADQVRQDVSMARRISSEVAPQNSPVWRAGISRWVERRLHCWAAFRDVLAWTG